MTALSLNPPLLAWLGPDDRIDPQARGVRPPGSAERAARARARPTPLWQAVLLAALLHLWAALLLGNVPPGTAQPGQGVGGALNIRLQDGSGPARQQQPAPAPPLPQSGPPGDAPRERHGGTVRRQLPPAAAEPGAARLGAWEQRAAPPPVPQQLAATLAPVSAAAPPLLDTVAAASLAALAPARSEPVEALAAPAVPALPAPLPAVAPLQALAERRLAPLEPPAATAALPAALPRLAAEPVLQHSGAAALALPALPALAEAPSARLASQAALDQPVQPLADAGPPLPLAAPAQALPEVQALPSLATLDAAAAPGPASEPASGPASRPASRPAIPRGAPDAGASVGADRATAPSAPASAPALNLNLPRPRGGELSRLGGAGLLPVLPRPPERKTALEEEIEAAGRADCRTAHASKGLLAVVPLALDTVRGQGGCKW